MNICPEHSPSAGPSHHTEGAGLSVGHCSSFGCTWSSGLALVQSLKLLGPVRTAHGVCVVTVLSVPCTASLASQTPTTSQTVADAGLGAHQDPHAHTCTTPRCNGLPSCDQTDCLLAWSSCCVLSAFGVNWPVAAACGMLRSGGGGCRSGRRESAKGSVGAAATG